MYEIDELSDEDYLEMDEGIRETIRFLRGHGFNTEDSGDGESKWPDGHDEDPSDPTALHMPNISIRVPPEDMVSEADRLYDLLESIGVPVSALSDGSQEEPSVEIQAAYDPGDGTVTILVMFLDDALLARVRTFS